MLQKYDVHKNDDGDWLISIRDPFSIDMIKYHHKNEWKTHSFSHSGYWLAGFKKHHVLNQEDINMVQEALQSITNYFQKLLDEITIENIIT